MKWTVAVSALCSRLVAAMAWTAVCTVPAAADSATRSTLEFDFAEHGNVAPTDLYDADRGYGYEPTSPNSPATRFSVRLREGNFRVTLRLGDPHEPSETTVKAEARRLMLERVSTARGKLVTRSFVVNVRTPALAEPPANAPGGTAVRLKPHEIGSPTWDEKLTLEFLGPAAKVRSLSVEPADVPTVYLAGDSTVTDQSVGPGASWGQMLPRFFGPGIAVANHAESGETLKSFLTALRLDKILSTLRAGDWLMIQFGHNDEKAQWPQTYVEAGTTYRAYLNAYIAEVRRRGATPILITSPERRNFDPAGHIVNTHRDYPDAVRALAAEQSVPLIDLNSMSKTFYEALGPDRAALAFNDQGRDLTHHDNYGAYELARLVVAGIRRAQPRLAGYLAADAGELDPARPDPPETFRLP
jgi:lysophospholipase L1-like esterase